MKKIIRIASVIALASASLLYVGCTKDFSADIAKTNQDVAALNQKIENLDATVQTINSTVANLQTTKADLSAVNALGDKVTTAEGKITTLGGKIDDLDGKLGQTKTDLLAAIATAKQEAIDAASADAATKLAAAKTELEGVIGDVNDRVDSLAAQTLVDEAAIEALDKDVDTLKTRVDELEDRIATLEGRVDALAARITSIVAVPSTSPEFSYISISGKDTAFFATTFAVTPKAAVNSIKPEDLKVNFKEGLTRLGGDEATGIDTTCKVSKVVADEAKGEITVFVPFAQPENFPDEYDFDYSHDYYCYGFLHGCYYEGGAGVTAIVNPHPTAVYFSLAFAGEDEAEAEYEVNSEYVKAHKEAQWITAWNAVIVKGGDEITEKDCELADTLAFDGSEGKGFTSLFNKLDVAFKVGDKLISKEVVSALIDTTFKVCADTLFISGAECGGYEQEYANDTTLGIYVSPKETQLFADSSKVGNYVKIISIRLKFNDEVVWAPSTLVETHVVGAKTVEYTLPAVTEEWTYTACDGVSRTISITNGTAAKKIHEVIDNYGEALESGKFTLDKDNGEGVNIVVDDVKFNEEAKDTTYEVKFTTDKAEIVRLGKPEVFTINWNYTLTARPADATVDLANVDTLANDYTKELKLAIDSKIVDKTFAKFDAAYDKAIDTVAVKNAIKSAKVELDSVVFGGKAVEGFTTDGKDINVPALSKAGEYAVTLHKVVFGIKYTYTYTITIGWKAEYKLHPTPYVSGDEAFVDADTTGGVYTLKNMDIAKYLQVFNRDTLAKDIPSDYEVRFKVELEDSAKFDNGVDDIEIGEVVAPESATINGGFLEECKLEWGEYKGRKVKVTAYLANAKDTVDTYTFTLKYEQPIRSFSAGTQTIKRVAGVNAKAVLSKSFEVKGLYHGDKNLIVDTTGAWINGKNYYECIIGYDIDHAVFKVDGVETTFKQGTDYTFNYEDAPETAVITFIGDNNNKNIEATIRVGLGYKYDYNHVEAYWDNVVIKVVNE